MHFKKDNQKQHYELCDQYLQLAQLVAHFILPSKQVGVKLDNLNTTEWNIYIYEKKQWKD